ncbi:MAG: hypothetical protein BA861_12715 [Desulfobacterales bacterium S3730MH5]|nr:MAG: hypothetical protein BA861_12715 [Desulfobacterales bacterium S3730MH5]
MQYTTDVRVIRIMCTGRMDPAVMADAFVHGLDGLLVLGCLFGECHYVTGNFNASHKVDMTKEMLAYAGMNPGRLSFRNLSSAEADVFVKHVTDFSKEIRELGPLGGEADKFPLPKLKEKLEIARISLAGPKLRWVVGKKPVFIETGNKYHEIFTEHEINRTLSGIVIDEMATHSILAALQKKPASVKELAKDLEIPPPETLKYVLGLKRRGFLELESVQDHSPLYKYVEQEA